ncbi:unnamed protein product [Ectocarpus fasciculatus]
MSDETLRQNLSSELETKELFAQAQRYAYEYMDSTGDAPVFPSESSLAALSVFDEAMPDSSQNGSEVLKQLHEVGGPATVRQTGGKYFGYVCGGILPVAAASRWLTDVWDQNTALYLQSPVAAKLEQVVEQWLADLLHLPADTAIGLVGGSSLATICGVAAARSALLAKKGWDVEAEGLFGAPPIRVVVSDQAHSSVFKALALLGLGRNRIEKVRTDEQGRMIVAEIPPLDSNTLVILSAGNVFTGSFDFIDALCDMAQKGGAWVHVDGAFGLWAAAAPKVAHLTKGMEKADSWCADAHKTLNSPYDCGIIFCKDRGALTTAMAASGSYLQESSLHRDAMFYTPDMSRRSRSLDLWVTLKSLGKQGVAALVEGLVDRAQEFSVQLQQAGFTVLHDVVFNQCMFRCDTDDSTVSTLKGVQSSGDMWCGAATWGGRPAIRISCCSWATSAADVVSCVGVILKARSSS